MKRVTGIERTGMTVWSIFDKDTEYFNPSRAPFMINYRVEDLDALLVCRPTLDLTTASSRARLRISHSELWEAPK